MSTYNAKVEFIANGLVISNGSGKLFQPNISPILEENSKVIEDALMKAQMGDIFEIQLTVKNTGGKNK